MGRLNITLPLTLDPDIEGIEAAKASAFWAFRAIDDDLALLCGLADRFPTLLKQSGDHEFQLLTDSPDLFDGNMHGSIAAGTGLVRVRLQPGERYREFVAAIALDRDLNIVESHGWPILSPGVEQMPSVTGSEAGLKAQPGRASSPASGGAA